MIQVNHFKDTITGAVNGIPYSVVYTKDKLESMKAIEAQVNKSSSLDEIAVLIKEFELLASENYGDLVQSSTPYVTLDPKTGYYHLKHGKQILRHRMPPGIVQRLIESVEQKINPLPLLKFYTRFLLNPVYSHDKLDRMVAYINTLYLNTERRDRLINDFGINPKIAEKRATIRQTPLTLEGQLVTYKVVEEIGSSKLAVDEKGEVVVFDRYAQRHDDTTGLKAHDIIPELEKLTFEPCVMHDGGDSFMCGEKLGHIIQVGKTHYLLHESQINTSDSQDCVPGIHCGNLNYIAGYQSSGTVTLNIYVDPQDVRAIPLQSTPAMRVKRFFAHSLFGVQNTSLYDSSPFVQDILSESFDEMIARAIYQANDITGTYEPKDYRYHKKAHFDH